MQRIEITNDVCAYRTYFIQNGTGKLEQILVTGFNVPEGWFTAQSKSGEKRNYQFADFNIASPLQCEWQPRDTGHYLFIESQE